MFLVESGTLLPNDDMMLASFLVSEPQLSKTQIGEFLCRGLFNRKFCLTFSDAFSTQVLRAFIQNIGFSGLDFVEAIR